MIARCPYCGSELAVAVSSRIVHHADGSHTVYPNPTPDGVLA